MIELFVKILALFWLIKMAIAIHQKRKDDAIIYGILCLICLA